MPKLGLHLVKIRLPPQKTQAHVYTLTYFIKPAKILFNFYLNNYPNSNPKGQPHLSGNTFEPFSRRNVEPRLTDPACFLLGIQRLVCRFMRAVEIAKTLAQTPEIGAPTHKSTTEDTIPPMIFIDVQRCIATSITIANIDPGIDLLEIFKFHPEEAVILSHKFQLFGNGRVLLPCGTFVGPFPLPFVRCLFHFIQWQYSKYERDQ